MDATLYILGMLLQTVAAVIALFQVRQAPRKLPWLLIALSSLLIVARRATSLNQVLEKGRPLALAEVLTLVISVLFFFGVVFMSRMFRESRRHQMELEQSQAALRIKNLVFDASIAANSIADLDGRITEVNQAFLRVWAYRCKEDVIGKSIPEFLCDPNQALVIVETLKKSGQWEGDYLAKKGDGSTFVGHGLATIIRDETGRAVGYQSAVMDITAYKQTEADLRRKEALLAQSQAMAHIGSWELDVAANRLSWSDETYRIFGLQPQEFAATYEAFLAAVHPEDRAAVDSTYSRSVQSRSGSYEIEHRIVRKDHGEVRYVYEKCVHERDLTGKIVRSVGMVQDVTDRKQAEENRSQLQHRLQLLQKSESLGRMAAAIAHHFNNQLQAVMLNLEMAMSDAPTESLAGAFRSARKAAEVSTLMLTYLGQTPTRRQPLDVSEVCQRNLPSLEAVLPKNVVLKTDLAASGLVVSANDNHLQQALTQLVTNASEALGDKGGLIRLSASLVSSDRIPARNRFPIDWRPSAKSYACLEVADMGCGIAEADMEKLFDPFFSTKFTGRGLGLSVVLGIVRAHDGAVTVASTPARGSVFSVYLPLSGEVAPRKTERPSQPLVPVKGGTVLVVEDNEAVRRSVAKGLERHGFLVLVAGDGVEAVEVFQAHQAEIGCVLCDLTMPRMDGWETLKALRQLAPEIPVILASGYSESEAMAGDHAEQPQAFLGKPYELKPLVDTVSRWMLNKKA